MLTVTGKNDRPAWCRCTPRPPRCWPATPPDATGSVPTAVSPGFFLTTHRPPGAATRRAAIFAKLLVAGRHPHAARAAPAQDPRSAAHVRGQHPDRLVPRRRGRARTPTGAVHVPRPCQPGGDVLVSAGRPGATRPGRRNGSNTTTRHRRCADPAPGEVRHDRSPAPAAGVLHRPADDPVRRQPAHDRRPTATPSSCCSATFTGRPASCPTGSSLADLDAATIGAFLQHLQTARGNSVATRNTRLAAIHSLFRYASLRAPEHADADRAACWPSRPNAPAPRSSPSSTPPNSTRCWPRRTSPAGTAAATTPCSSSPRRPGCGSRELTGLAVGDVHLGHRRRTSTAAAKAAKTAAPH